MGPRHVGLLVAGDVARIIHRMAGLVEIAVVAGGYSVTAAAIISADHPKETPLSKFTEQLARAWQRSNSMLCVGLDPDLAKIPASLRNDPKAIYRFCEAIVDATGDLVCAFKPQIAYFAAARAETQLEDLIGHIHRRWPGVPVILDAKRGDIGATAERYASEAFERYNADALTLSPYMGYDSLEPYLAFAERGLFLLCRTSNPGGDDLQMQDLAANARPLYEHVAALAAGAWNQQGQLGLVVGATYPEQLARVRAIAPTLPLLVPGIGAQGGDVNASVSAGIAADGYGLVVSSSRAILYAGSDSKFAEAARRVAVETRDALRQAAAAARQRPS